MTRPWRKRVWVYRPTWDWEWRWILRWSWKPVGTGCDEYDWHTLVLGFPWTGEVVIATRPCPGSRGWRKRCRENEELWGPLPLWPYHKYALEELP